MNSALEEAIDKVVSVGKSSCPVCGYYCLGNGGQGCVDKKAQFEAAQRLMFLAEKKASKND